MKIDIQDIKLVAVIARTGSITAGAAAINLALGSASERLRILEQGLGTPLFDRLPRGVAATLAGEAFLRHALPILSHHEALRREVVDIARGMSGRIRIAANSFAASHLLGEPLTEFLLARPKVSVAVQEMPTERALTAVLNAEADVGVGVVSGSFTNLDVLALLDETIVAVVSADHPLAGMSSAAFSEVLDHDLLLAGTSSALQQFLQDRADQLGKPMRLRAVMHDAETICLMAARGVAAGIVFGGVARRGANFCDVRTVPLSDPWSLRKISAFWHRERALADPVRELIAILGGPRQR
ncbi:MAG: LysR substrate-binding domain-containing protein [Pseudomonadota bacterium]